MILNLYSIKDDLAGAFQPPFAHNNKETAKRAIRFALEQPGQNPIKENWKDKQLFEVGKFDDEKGEIVETKKDFVCNFTELMNKVEIIKEEPKNYLGE